MVQISRKRLVGRTIAATIAMLFVGVFIVGCQRGGDSSGKGVPTRLELLDLEGKSFDFSSQIEKSATVVVFVRTDCPVSNRLAPEVCRLYETYHARGVAFFLIYVDPRETVEAIRGHLNDYHYPFAGLRDPKHVLVNQCHATATPEAVLFRKGGEIAYQGRINDLYADIGQPRSEPTRYDLAEAMDAVLAGRPVAEPRTRAYGCSIADVKE